MEPLSNRVKDLIPKSLHRIAETVNDHRCAAACWELSVCYCSEYGLPMENAENDQMFAVDAVKYLLRSAESGDNWARLAIVPIFEALGQQLPHDNNNLVEWLQTLARTGSQTARFQLRKLSFQPTYKMKSRDVLSIDRSMFIGLDQKEVQLNSQGESVLHRAASSGNFELAERFLSLHSDASEINRQSHSGDTPLLQAMRAGHTHIVDKLVSQRADGTILNHARESPLHFLAYLEDHVQARDTLKLLVRAGARRHLQTPALSSTCDEEYSMTPTGSGTPAHRAVLAGNAYVLKTLLQLETGTTNRELRTSNAMLRQMLAHAVKLRYVGVMEILVMRLGPSEDHPKIRIWDNGRLMTTEELWIHGSVSTNRASGYDWPEKFSRMMSFGPSYQVVLKDSFDLLSRHGYFDRDYHRYMQIAIEKSRRDVVSCLIIPLTTNFSSLPPRKPHILPRVEQLPGLMNPWSDQFQVAKPDKGVKPWAAIESSGAPPLADPNTPWPFKNHRWAWILAEWVDFAVINNQRGIFSDLLMFGKGLALAPGTPFLLKWEKDQPHQPKPLHQDETVATSGQIPPLKYRQLLPPPANQYRFSAVAGLEETASDKNHHFDGTLNYALMYMNTISRCSHRDMSMPLVVAFKRVL